MDLPIFYLLMQGQLAPSSLDEVAISPQLLPVYNTIKYMLARGEPTPLALQTLRDIAKTKYKINKTVKDFLDQLGAYVPSASLLEATHNGLVVKRVSQLAMEQLSSGEFNLDALAAPLATGGTVVDKYIQKPSAPVEGVDSTYKYKTNIPQLDKIIRGLNDELVVVSARFKHGKSNFFLNLVHRNPDMRILYITVMDYSHDDLCNALCRLDPHIVTRSNLFIADFNSISARVSDIDAAIRTTKPQMVIVDRAEEMVVSGKFTEVRHSIKAIFKQLRGLAKRHNCVLFTDRQLSESGEANAQKGGQFLVSPSDMAEDRTGTGAVLDLFFGLYRKDRVSYVSVFGRRPRLPAQCIIKTDPEGRYLDDKSHQQTDEDNFE